MVQGGETSQVVRLIDLQPGLLDEYSPLWGCAVDIGTTTVTLWLVDLITGQVKAQASEYNGQIARGEDVISRIIFAGKNGGDELRQRVLDTINNLLELACKRVKMPQGKVTPDQVVKMTIAGNSTMIHLLLGIPAGSIRLSPFITAINHPPLMTGREVGVEYASRCDRGLSARCGQLCWRRYHRRCVVLRIGKGRECNALPGCRHQW